MCVADGARWGCLHWLGLPGTKDFTTKQWRAPRHWSKSPVYSYLELGGQELGFLPLLVLFYPDHRLASLKGTPPLFFFLVVVILNTNICLPVPQYVLCRKFRVFGQLLNVFWVLCSLEIEMICLFLFLQTFVFILCFVSAGVRIATPSRLYGAVFSTFAKIANGTCVFFHSVLPKANTYQLFLSLIFCVCFKVSLCVCVCGHPTLFEERFGLG